MKFSIIIPNYNKGQYIGECLDSIKNQTYNNYEILFIDDGSTDESLDIVKNYDVILFKTNRLGAGGARNLGLDNVTGDYIIFLDSDDYLANDTVLEKLANKLNGEDLIFFDYKREYSDTDKVIEEEKEDLTEKIEKTKKLGCPTKAYKREILEGIRFPERKRFEDINFALEAMCRSNSYTYFDDIFFVYRKVSDSNMTKEITVDVMIDIVEEYIKMYRLCFKYPKYKNNILNRIKEYNIPETLKKINNLIEETKSE